ncbi:MAG: MFS transporter, partial [Pseudonocardiaceae bacterium]
TLVGAAAGSAPVFVLARIGQGLGCAALIACGLGLIGAAFASGQDRARATGVWGASVGAGIACGPLLAAVADPVLGWRWPYVLIAALTTGLAVLARFLLVESRAEVAHPVDVVGAVLLGVGLSTVLAGLVIGRTGWLQPRALLLLAGGALLLVAFALAEWHLGRRGGAPLLELRLFHRADFVAVTVAGLSTGLGVIAVMSFLPTVLERGMGRSALLASLGLVIWSGISVPTALAARRLRVRGELQLAAGLLVVAAGMVSLTGLGPSDGLVRLTPGLIVAGLGSGVLNAALGRQAVASVPPGRAGMGSGVNNTARYLGSALGVTVVGVLATRPGAGGLLVNWDEAILVSIGFSVLGAIAVLLCARRR